MSDTPELSGSDTLESLCAAVGATVGGTVAGPFGIVIGGMAGRLLKRIIFNPDDFAYGIITNLTSDAISGGFGAVSQRIQNRLKAKPNPAIGDALQAALSQALQAAVAELDGRKRSKTEVKNAPKVPDGVVYRNLASGSLLWKDDSGTGARIDNFFDALAKHVADPALLYGKVEAQTFLQSSTPNDTSTDFYMAVVTPVLAKFSTLEKDAPDFLKLLRANLFSRTAAHLDTLIINDAGAWRTFNRLVLDEMRAEIGKLHAGQAGITLLVTTILNAQNRVEALSTRLVEQLVALGQSEAMLANSFDELYTRLDQWQAEQNRHFEKIHDDHARQDEKLDRIETKLDTKLSPTLLHIGVPSSGRELVGRELLLDNVVERLLNGENLALYGREGIGKTALAIAIANDERILQHFSDGILWGSLGTSPNVAEVLDRWGQALGIDVTQIVDITDRAQAVKNVIGTRRFLLVIDDSWGGEVNAAALLRCGGPNSAHLFTTRFLRLARSLAGDKRFLEVKRLSIKAASQLLRKLAPEAWKRDAAKMRDLAAAVDYIPLALELMGNFLAQPDYTAFPELTQDRLAKLADPQARLDLAQERLGQPGSKPTWAEVIKLSLSGLPEEAVRAFYMLGAFAPQPARFDKQAALAVTESTLQTLSLLQDRGLLEIDKDGWLSLHQTIAEVAKRKIEQVNAEAVHRHRDYYLRLVENDHTNWQQIELIYGQIQKAWTILPANSAFVFDFLNALSTYQNRRGLWGEREGWLKLAISLAESKKMQRTVAAQLNSLGNTYARQGNYSQANQAYNQALLIFQNMNDLEGQASTLTNLGYSYHGQQRWTEALELYERSLEICRASGNRRVESSTLNNKGVVYESRGQWSEAIQAYELALEVFQRFEDPNGEMSARANIGNIYFHQNQWDKARDAYEQALTGFRKMGDRHREGGMLNNLGNVCYKQRHWNEATHLYKQALAIRQEIKDRPGEEETLGNLGNILMDLGHYHEAIKMYEQALGLCLMLGNRRGEGMTLTNLGNAYRNQGDLDTAIEKYEQALTLQSKIEDISAMSDTLNNMGILYVSQKRWTDAIDAYEQALEIYQRLGNKDGEGATLNNIGSYYAKQGYWDQAIQKFSASQDLFRKLNERHGEGRALMNIGSIYRGLGNVEEAQKCYQEALTKLHPDSPEYQTVRGWLGLDDATQAANT